MRKIKGREGEKWEIEGKSDIDEKRIGNIGERRWNEVNEKIKDEGDMEDGRIVKVLRKKENIERDWGGWKSWIIEKVDGKNKSKVISGEIEIGKMEKRIIDVSLREIERKEKEKIDLIGDRRIDEKIVEEMVVVGLRRGIKFEGRNGKRKIIKEEKKEVIKKKIWGKKSLRKEEIEEERWKEKGDREIEERRKKKEEIREFEMKIKSKLKGKSED